MTIWRFSDGTVVHLGGEVEGGSLFAQELREALADRPGVQIWPNPQRGVSLDVNDIALMDAWVRQEMTRPYRSSLGLRLVEAPKDVPALPPAPGTKRREEDGIIVIH